MRQFTGYSSEAISQEGSLQASGAAVDKIQGLKTAIWLYFWLLIFEGALRKWFLPGLSEPLLVVRDPVAIWIVYQAITQSLWKPNGYVIIIWGVTISSLIVTLLMGHGNLLVAIYGLRITLIHFPLIFVIGNIFSKEDVLKLGKYLLWLNIGMTILVAIQFYSPQSAWVNLGVGGDVEGSGFSGAGNFFRVPGTFSFTNGLSLFYGLVAAFIFFFWSDQRSGTVKKYLLIISTLALLAAIPLSISRTVLFEILLSFCFLLWTLGKTPKVFKKLLMLTVVGGFLFVVLNQFGFFQTAVLTFSDRFNSASTVEGGLEGTLIDRFLGGMYESVTNSNASFSGMGIGLGTNAGAKLMTGRRDFLIAEGEWGRLIGEMGFLLGFAVILLRGSLVFQLISASWREISQGSLLPWMLMSFGALTILQGQWAQPTALGFAILVGGLAIASLKQE